MLLKIQAYVPGLDLLMLLGRDISLEPPDQVHKVSFDQGYCMQSSIYFIYSKHSKCQAVARWLVSAWTFSQLFKKKLFY